MVFNDVGQKADVSDAGLRVEYALLVIFRQAGLPVIPALFTVPEYVLLKIEHAGEITALTDKIRNLLRLLVEDLAHGKCPVF